MQDLGPGGVLLTSYGVLSRDAAAGLGGERRVALTGTPVENRLHELWALLNLLNPGLLGSLAQFRQRFAIPIERDQDQTAAERLRGLTGPFLLRRLKSDRAILPDLPGKIEQIELCQLSEEQATLYQAVADELLEQAAASDGIERQGLVLAGLTRLKQVCNHPARYLADGTDLAGAAAAIRSGCMAAWAAAPIASASCAACMCTSWCVAARWGRILRGRGSASCAAMAPAPLVRPCTSPHSGAYPANRPPGIP